MADHSAEYDQALDDDVFALAKSLYLGDEPWERLASSFRASLISEAYDRLDPSNPAGRTGEVPGVDPWGLAGMA